MNTSGEQGCKYTLKWPHERLNLPRKKNALKKFLKIISGPMYAGKSGGMVEDVKRYVKGDHKCIIVKHASDKRYTDAEEIVTHDGVKYTALPTEKLSSVLDILLEHEVIGIDEGSFFTDLYDVVTVLLLADKSVFISLLDRGYSGEYFILKDRVDQLTWLDLLQLADEHHEAAGVCSICNSVDARYTLKVANDTKLVDIGADGKYACVCKPCWDEVTGGTGILKPTPTSTE